MTQSSGATTASDEQQRPRLWLVSGIFYPDLTSTGYYMSALARGLSAKFDIKVLCGRPNYSGKGHIVPRHDFYHEAEVFRCSGTTLDRNVVVYRVINMVTLGVSALFTSVRKFRRGDRVLVVTTPPNMPFIAAVAALLRGAVYTLLIHDLYPDVLVAVGKVKANSVTARILAFLNRWLYKHSSKIIVVGRDMKKLISARSSGLDVPITVIPNWAEIEDVIPLPRSESTILSGLGIADRLVIMHAGNIGHPTDVETIIDTLKHYAGDKRFHFLFVGDGVKGQMLERAAKEYDLTNMTLLGPRPRNEQIEFLNACDVGLVSLVAGMKGVAMPSKTYNIMAAGKPILAIAEAGSELARVIDEERIGWRVDPSDSTALAKVLDAISSDRDVLIDMGRRARVAAENRYSLEVAITSYLNELT